MAEERTESAVAMERSMERSPVATDTAGAASLDKVREILFGSQARDYEKRFARLEERLVKESNDLKDETRRRFEALETYIKKELDALGERLRGEQGERKETVAAVLREMKERSEAFVRKTDQLDDLINRAQRELREQLLEQSKQLSDDIRQKHDEVLRALSQESSELRADKTDRAALAAMFTELAMRLRNEFHLPDSPGLLGSAHTSEDGNNG